MSSVNSIRIGDIVNFKRGYDLPAAERLAGQYPVISSGGISGFHSDYKKDGEGIITGRYGTLGEVYYINGKYWPHNTTLYSTNFYENIPRYVFYLMKCLGNLKTSDKSTVPGINRNDLHELIVPYIESKLAQRHIASTLSMLDSKIELNNKINDNLEQMVKAIYNYWFVQFDFPNEQGKPYKSSGGKMVYDEQLKRIIPEGWESTTLSFLCDKIGDGVHGTPNYVNSSTFKFINGNNLRNGFIEINGDTKSVSAQEYQKYFVELTNNTVLLSINGTIGKVASYTGEPVILGKSSAYINCKNDYKNYCYNYLQLDQVQRKLWNIATGSTIKNLSLDSIKNLIIPSPRINIIESYNRNTVPVFNKMVNIFKQNQELSALRDWLLPMLMNGQVTVK